MMRIGIAGCGAISQVHSAVVKAIPEEATLVGCADIKFDRAQRMASEHPSCTAFSDVESMLRSIHPDILHICTPHPLHTPIAQLAASYGVHVITEKPPAVDLGQWNTLSSIDNVRIGVCFQNRFNPAVCAMKELLKSGKAGKVKGARAFVTWNRESPYYTDSDWRGSWKTEGGGVLINQSIHTLDLLVYLLGKPELVGCHMTNRHLQDIIEVEDTVDAYIRFGDASVVFYATHGYCTDSPVFVEIVCEHVTMQMEGANLKLLWNDGHTETPEFIQNTSLGKNYWGNGHLTCIQSFYKAVRENIPFINDLKNTENTLRLMFDMYKGFRP